ncbi:hypothetical protein [Deinococcus navajonensis]|uniref:Uncharacterized protein n=1 Tax=Deinococcus navajonensis TaxID=309884 RepID=A0ABV8XQ12_9DEIO
MKRPTVAPVGHSRGLSHLYELACLDAQRPGNIGAGLKVLESMLRLPHFQPRKGGKA